MARGRLTFRQSDLTRAVKAVRAAGVDIARVEIEPAGKIVIIAGHAGVVELGKPDRNPWDEPDAATSL